MANSRLTRNISSAGSSQRGTLSMWVKRSEAPASGSNAYPRIYQNEYSNSNFFEVFFTNGGELQVDNYASDSTNLRLRTNRKFRDFSAWYHILISIDTTQNTEADRCKIYINGTQETSFGTSTYPSQNTNLLLTNSGYQQHIGYSGYSSEQYFGGYISHAAYIDGTALTPTTFGSIDSTSGIWKFKSPSGVTWGTNGFHLKFENSGALGTDSSGNSNTFTVNGNLKQSLDTPSNVYCTMNPLYNFYRDPTLSIGNTKIVDTNGWSGAKATLGFSTGKWYWEIKLTGTMENHIHGVQQENVNVISQDPQQRTGTTVFYNHDGGEMRTDGTQTTADYGTFSSGDIMGVAVDMTAGSYGQMTIYKNGVALVSNFNLSSSSTTVMPFSTVGNCTTEYNFGNGYFGTTAITSAGSNGNGSLFEYDVPSGYYALNTKNLNTYG
jgi:hypothetical protein